MTARGIEAAKPARPQGSTAGESPVRQDAPEIRDLETTMTAPHTSAIEVTQQAVTVAQEDREAAASLVVPHGRWPGFPSDFLSGRADRNELTQAFARHRRASVSSASADYVLVPRDPTPKMIAATWDHPIDKNGGLESQNTRNERIYRAMLAASPEPVPATNQAGEVEVLPCPFCGSSTAPYVHPTRIAHWFGVTCDDEKGGCGASIVDDGREIAILSWNTRDDTVARACAKIADDRANAYLGVDAEELSGIEIDIGSTIARGIADDIRFQFVRSVPPIPLATQPATSQEGEGRCPASPDHADIKETIKETIEDAADDWQAKGYTSALAEVRDMAAVGRSLMEALPKGYCYMDSPAEIVSDLQNELDEALAATPTPPTQTREAEVRSALIDSLSAELDGSYDCGRVWSAWSYGTMGEDDFSPITDRVEEIADGIIAALSAGSADNVR